jgi:hypothetical protein
MFSVPPQSAMDARPRMMDSAPRQTASNPLPLRANKNNGHSWLVQSASKTNQSLLMVKDGAGTATPLLRATWRDK